MWETAEGKHFCPEQWRMNIASPLSFPLHMTKEIAGTECEPLQMSFQCAKQNAGYCSFPSLFQF